MNHHDSRPNGRCSFIHSGGTFGIQNRGSESVITPPIGTSINGGFQDRTVRNVHDETYTRAMVLDNGENHLAIPVADLCMIHRETVDQAKERATVFTGIPTNDMLISITHTNLFWPGQIADTVIRANKNLVKARIGRGVASEAGLEFKRRWKLKPVKLP